jgi:hypothetical protein
MLMNGNEYFATLNDVKQRIKEAQYQAMLGANRELATLT